MIKQSIILSIILLILIVLAFSFKKKPKQNLLWEISSPLTNEKSYLFGTIHLIEKEFFQFPDFLKEKINQSTNIIFETPYPNSTNIRSLMLIPNNENIFSYLNENEKNKILIWSAENLKMDENEFLENYGNFKPFVLFQTITQLPFLDKSVSYEQEIYKIVKNSSKKIEGLETVEEQIELLDKIPLEIQKRQLFFSIDSTIMNQKILRE
ncbi:MAG: TraB/GumN family protein, partial [Crocinitomicaceae bacterium]